MSIAEAAPLLTNESLSLIIKLSIVANAGLLIFAVLCIEKSIELKDYANNPEKDYFDSDLKNFIKVQRESILKDSRAALIKGVIGVLLAIFGIGLICYTTSDFSNRAAAYAFAAFGVVSIAMRGGLTVISDYFAFKRLKKNVRDNSVALEEFSRVQKKIFNRAFPFFTGCTVLSVYLLSQINLF